MNVLCKLHRVGGSKIHFGKGKDLVEYHFKPLDPNAKMDDPRVPHVAHVSNKEHLGRLLSIEGYELYDGPGGASVPSKPASLAESAPLASGSASAGFQLHESVHAAIASGSPVSLVLEGDVVKAVPHKAPSAKVPSKPKKEAPGDGKAPKEMSKDELVAAVAKKLGKKPHPSTSEKKLREILAG